MHGCRTTAIPLQGNSIPGIVANIPIQVKILFLAVFLRCRNSGFPVCTVLLTAIAYFVLACGAITNEMYRLVGE